MSILLAAGAWAATLPERSVSPTRQFIIYGADARLRGAVSELAEKTKTNLLALLRRPDRWKTPVLVNLQTPQTTQPELPPAALRFSQTGFGLKLQLDLMVGEKIDPARVERELLRAIVLEMVYRREQNIAAGSPFVSPPDWLLDGVLALTPGRDRTLLLEMLPLAAKVMPLEDFLRQQPALLDSPARLLYRAYSLALVQLLVSSEDGPARLARYIDNLSRASNDPLSDLRQQFPLFREHAEETWQAQIATVSAPQNYQLLSFTGTENRLKEILPATGIVSADVAKPVRLEELVRRKATPAEKAALKPVGEELLLLVARAHPVMRPLVQEYHDISALLLAGKRRGLVTRLSRLQATRATLVARMNEIDDYMNWFEVTQRKNKSGVFVDYLRSADQAGEPQPRRRDPISVYLDAIEQQFQN